jgi:hypothetical protein
MKKLSVALLVMALGAGVAYASSLTVPWFVDNSGPAANFPPLPGKGGGVSGIVFLHNNKTTTVTCSIQYFSENGINLGPPSNNSFTINPSSTIAFRPVADDPNSVGGGQEAVSGRAVPNRPSNNATEIAAGGAKKNGSLVVSWFGDGGDVQGIYQQGQVVVQPDSPIGKAFIWGTLLPPGV